MERVREVNVSMSAVETAREFCRAWFEKLDLDEVIAFLAEDNSQPWATGCPP